MSSIAIILPTYNGSKYVNKTLESIENQTLSGLTVLIRDDGSADDTVAKIEDFISRDKLKNSYVFLRDDKGNLGCPASFYQIICSQEPFDYYAFCDQDDLWAPNKIERAIKAIENAGNEDATVYFSSFDYCDEDLTFIRRSPRQSANLSLSETLYYTPGLGFTIVFNNEACERFIRSVNPGKQMHDRWILRCGACMGTVIYDEEATAMHIRHSDAVTADDNKKGDLLKHFVKAELLGSDAEDAREKIAYFLDTFRGELSKDDVFILELFSKNKRTLSNRVKKAFYPHKLRASIASEAAIRLLLLMGKA